MPASRCLLQVNREAAREDKGEREGNPHTHPIP